MRGAVLATDPVFAMCRIRMDASWTTVGLLVTVRAAAVKLFHAGGTTLECDAHTCYCARRHTNSPTPSCCRGNMCMTGESICQADTFDDCRTASGEEGYACKNGYHFDTNHERCLNDAEEAMIAKQAADDAARKREREQEQQQDDALAAAGGIGGFFVFLCFASALYNKCKKKQPGPAATQQLQMSPAQNFQMSSFAQQPYVPPQMAAPQPPML